VSFVFISLWFYCNSQCPDSTLWLYQIPFPTIRFLGFIICLLMWRWFWCWLDSIQWKSTEYKTLNKPGVDPLSMCSVITTSNSLPVRSCSFNVRSTFQRLQIIIFYWYPRHSHKNHHWNSICGVSLVLQVGKNLHVLSQLEGVGLEMYKDVVLPRVLEQV